MFARSIHKADAAPGARPAQLASRICQVPGCSFAVPQKHLMCPEHWFELPVNMRIQVTASWLLWYGGDATVRPYMAARLAAVVYVAKLHGENVTALEAKLTKARADLQAERTQTPEPHLKEEKQS
jgi:hypothetical protein